MAAGGPPVTERSRAPCLDGEHRNPVHGEHAGLEPAELRVRAVLELASLDRNETGDVELGGQRLEVRGVAAVLLVVDEDSAEDVDQVLSRTRSREKPAQPNRPSAPATCVHDL
jgi:hypothetical protein